MVKKGIKAEQRVATSLRSAGAKVKISPGSRTKTDLEARWQSGKRWLTQVKYSPTSKPAGLSSIEKRALNSRATKLGATPVHAAVTPKKIEYQSARNSRKLHPYK